MSKKRFKKGLALLLSALMAFSVCSATVVSAGAVESTAISSGGIYGDYGYAVLDDGTVEIDNYYGSDAEIVIPSEIDGKSVTSIGYGAFYNCTGLTSVTIPDSVTSIGRSAFSGCTGLTSVTIGNGVTSIGDLAFEDCTGLTSITIPDGVTSIGSYAFFYCTGLTSITIPNSVTSIGSSAFSRCTGLTSIIIPDGVRSIGGDAFYNTAWYNKQPDGLVYAGKVAYEYKGEMPENTEIVLQDGTLGIAGHAFSGCTGLTSVIIPDSVTSTCN